MAQSIGRAEAVVGVSILAGSELDQRLLSGLRTPVDRDAQSANRRLAHFGRWIGDGFGEGRHGGLAEQTMAARLRRGGADVGILGFQQFLYDGPGPRSAHQGERRKVAIDNGPRLRAVTER